MLGLARLKKGTAQSFILANLARIFINMSWYDSTNIPTTLSTPPMFKLRKPTHRNIAPSAEKDTFCDGIRCSLPGGVRGKSS